MAATIEPTAVNSNGTRYTTFDILSSPRVVTNSSSNVVSRHDYKPFGEELGAGIGGRNVGMGFGVADGLRQKFTQKERDNETGLDYFSARYYSSSQGRFTSADSVAGSAVNPQTLNLYAYVLNNPLKYVDPSGHFAQTWNIDPLDFIFGRNPSDYMLVSEQGQTSQQGQPQQATATAARTSSGLEKPNVDSHQPNNCRHPGGRRASPAGRDSKTYQFVVHPRRRSKSLSTN